jgi:DNA-binding NarL/FixJ family response regulator
VSTILVAADAAYVRDEVIANLTGEYEVLAVGNGRDVRPALEQYNVDLAILDMQMGSMGGVAATMDIRLEEGAGRIGHVAVLLLLDRRPDVFLARRAGADGFLVKPVSPVKLRRAVRALLDGGEYEDAAYVPTPVVAT